MSDENTIAKIVHEASPRYVVDAHQRPVGFLLTPEEYADYLEMLEDRADSQDEDLSHRLSQAAAAPTTERSTLRDYLRRRPPADATLQS